MPVALGFDLSTQSCKCVAVDSATLEIVLCSRVVYDEHFSSSYGVVDGVHRHDGAIVTTPTAMLIDALERCAREMAGLLSSKGIALADVCALSGSAQQHATVFWRLSFSDDPHWSTLEDVKQSLSVQDSPVWMDHSTSEICRELSERLGGDAAVRRLTGSRPTERFSALQVAAVLRRSADARRLTCAVSLASSLATSLFTGRLCAVDRVDAAGTNAVDISTGTWAPSVMEALNIPRELFGDEPVDAASVAASLGASNLGASFWCASPPAGLGLPASLAIVPFSGDNPCAVVGMGLVSEGDILVSLGTSDTCMVVTSAAVSLALDDVPFAHTFPHPLDATLRFHMLVYSNGDLSRRLVRDRHCGGSWSTFSLHLRETQRRPDLTTRAAGCYGGVEWAVDEISPPLRRPQRHGTLLFEGDSTVVAFSDARCHARAAVESRAFFIQQHVQQLLSTSPDSRGKSGTLLLTGGAAANAEILQVYADVFQRPVFTLDVPDAAAYGAAVRALWASGGSPRDRILSHITSRGPAAAAPVANSVSLDEVRACFFEKVVIPLVKGEVD